MAGPSKFGGSMGVMLFALRDEHRWAAPWQDRLRGEKRGWVLASGFPLLLGELIRGNTAIDPVPAFVAEPEDDGTPRIPVPAEPADSRKLADRGRERDFRWYLKGQFQLGETGLLNVCLIDCERRNDVAALELELPSYDLCAWTDSVLRWLAASAPWKDSIITELKTGTSSSEALELYLRALREFHLTDSQGQPLHGDRIVADLADALHHDPGFFSAAATLVLFVRDRLRPQELGYLRQAAPQLLDSLAKCPPEQGKTVLVVASALMPAIEAKDVAVLLERPLAAEFECSRLTMLARIHRLDNQPERALKTARTALQRFPSEVGALEVVAELLEADRPRGVNPEALELWHKVLEREPEHTRALESVIRGATEDDPEAAREYAVRALAHEPSWRLFEVLIPLARRVAAPAKKSLLEAVTSVALGQRSNAVVHGYFGLLLYALGETERAQLHFTVALDEGLTHPYAARIHALHHRPGDWEFAERFEALVHRILQDPQGDALADLNALRDQEAEFWPAWFLRGLAAARSDETDTARQHFEQAMTLSRNQPEVLFHLAVLERLQENHDRASTLILEAIRRAPNNHSFWLELAEISGGRGDRERAEEALEQVLRLRPGHRRGTELRAELRESARFKNAAQ